VGSICQPGRLSGVHVCHGAATLCLVSTPGETQSDVVRNPCAGPGEPAPLLCVDGLAGVHPLFGAFIAGICGLEGEAGGEDVGVVVAVEGGGGDLEAGSEDEGEAVAGGVAEVDLADHEAGREEGLILSVVGTLVIVV
jgi:hypothetical protein